MTLNQIYCLARYAFKKPAKLLNYLKFGYVCGTEICVNDQLKLVYVVNPKVASTSILEMMSGVNREALQKQGVDIAEIRARIGTRPIRSKHDLSDLQARGYKVFTFVRNPYERAISFFKNKFETTDGDCLKPVLFSEKCGFERCQRFEDVLEKMLTTPASIGDAHFISQVDVLYGKSPGFEYDFIGKIEQFDEDYVKLKKLIGSLPDVKQRNATTKTNAPIDQYFSAPLKKRFVEKFKQDFERFDYDV